MNGKYNPDIVSSLFSGFNKNLNNASSLSRKGAFRYDNGDYRHWFDYYAGNHMFFMVRPESFITDYTGIFSKNIIWLLDNITDNVIKNKLTNKQKKSNVDNLVDIFTITKSLANPISWFYFNSRFIDDDPTSYSAANEDVIWSS